MKGTGKLAVLNEAKGSFEIKTHELPEVKPGTCLIKTQLTGVCATDVHYWMGFMPNYDLLYPAVFGHEFCGEIVEKGEGFDKDYLGRSLEVGDRIIVKPQAVCGTCLNCASGIPYKCLNALSYGDVGYRAPWFSGGFSEYVYLDIPDTKVFKTNIPARRAVLLEPLSIAVNMINKARQRIGDTVVIQGSGPIGLLMLACAKYYGAAKVIVVGGPSNRLKTAKELGADVTIDISEVRDPAERLKMVLAETINGRGADVVYECAGLPNVVPEGLKYLSIGGTFGEMGNFVDMGECSINPCIDLCDKCITLVGTWASKTEHFIQALSIMENSGIPFEKIVTHTCSLDEITDAFKSISGNYDFKGSTAIKIAVDPWGIEK